MRLSASFALILAGFSLMPVAAESRVRAGGMRGGGAMVRSSTTYRPGAGVTHSTTVAAGRYHTASTLPAYRPAVSYPGAAVRTVSRVARRTAYRTASGYSYYYGAAVYALPSSACYAVMWEGMTAYNCNGVIYINQDSQYYPIEGA